MKLRKFFNILVALIGLGGASLALAGDPKTLIEMEGGSPKAALAKSWKKVKDGEYEFVLDTSKEVSKGKTVAPAMVKQSLESKLGSTYGVKVTEKGADKVNVAYTGDEKAFLDQVSKAKIRGGKDVELALEASVSEGGIRAAPKNRNAEAGEVKASFLSQKDGVVTAKVTESKFDGIKKGDKVTIKGELKGRKGGELLFFKPEKKDGANWMPKADSLL